MISHSESVSDTPDNPVHLESLLPGYWSEVEFAHRLRRSVRTLRRMVERGLGPKPIRVCGAGTGVRACLTLYRTRDVEQWLRSLANQPLRRCRGRVAALDSESLALARPQHRRLHLVPPLRLCPHRHTDENRNARGMYTCENYNGANAPTCRSSQALRAQVVNGGLEVILPLLGNPLAGRHSMFEICPFHRIERVRLKKERRRRLLKNRISGLRDLAVLAEIVPFKVRQVPLPDQLGYAIVKVNLPVGAVTRRAAQFNHSWRRRHDETRLPDGL